MQRRILILNFIHNIFTFVTQKVVICVILVLEIEPTTIEILDGTTVS